MPDPVIQLANEFRAALLARERKAAIRLIIAYGTIWERLSKQIAALGAQIREAQGRGEIVNQSWLFRERRYGDLLRQVEAEFQRFANISDSAITKQQSIAAKTGLSDSFALMTTAAESADISATFTKLPVAAVENMAGFLSNGAPLRSLLDQLPRASRKIVEDALLESVALGINPRTTASKIKQALHGNLTRALSLARNEPLRAYRTASLQTYQANSDIVSGWYWRSSRSRRACLACIALDGQFFPLREPMKFHSRCRCTLIPAIKGVAVDKGTAWFNKQPADVQKDIVGTEIGYRALKNGDLTLKDFVGLERNPLWGEAFHQLSVKRALAGEAQFPK